MHKQTLLEVTAERNIDIADMSAADFTLLLSQLDIKLHTIDYFESKVAMHAIISQDIKEHMYSVIFVHISDDRSRYYAQVLEVTSSLVDAIHAMSEQLKVDFAHS